MKYVLLFVSIFCVLFSCNNEDDAENSVYSSEYQRHIIYKDSISNFEGNGVVRISKKNDLYNFDFEVENGKALKRVALTVNYKCKLPLFRHNQK